MKNDSKSDHGAENSSITGVAGVTDGVHLQLRLLGGFELTRADDGSRLQPPPKKSRAMLAYLALTPTGASREKMAALLWPDSGEEQARASLRQALAGLRRLLGEPGDDHDGGGLRTTGGELTLDAAPIAVDALQLASLIGEGGRTQLEAAARLCKGPLLDGLDVQADPFDEWLTAERSRLSALASMGLSALLELQIASGDLDEAAETSARLLACAPLREDTHRSVMRMHLGGGRFNDALEQYAQCERLLRAELGIGPDPETVALRDEVLARRDAGDGPGPQRSAPSTTPPRRLPFAPGRDEGKPSLVVLPFDSLTVGTEHEHFADGVTEDITTALSRLAELFVIARNTAFTYKGRAATAEDLRRDLGVQYLLNGTIRRAGDRVRLTAQLVETGEGRHVWAQRYDRELQDVFELQDDLTQAVVGVLPGRVRDFEARRIARQPPEDMAAYELLLAGKIHHHRFTREDNLRSMELLDRAIAIDPDYAAAWAWKACVLGQALGRGFQPDPQHLFNSSQHCARRGLELDGNEMECHRILSEISIESHDLDSAEHHNERALQLNPNDPRLVAQRGELLIWRGEAASAVEPITAAMRLDPYGAADWSHQLGRARLQLGDYAGAIEAYKTSAYPRYSHHADMAACHAALGAMQRADDEVRRTLELKPDFTRKSYVEGLPYAREEDRRRHRALLEATSLP